MEGSSHRPAKNLCPHEKSDRPLQKQKQTTHQYQLEASMHNGETPNMIQMQWTHRQEERTQELWKQKTSFQEEPTMNNV
jgi:hypothetical protein